MELGREIAKLAKQKRICGPAYLEILKSTELSSLCDMYFKGDDWAMREDFPDLHTLRRFNDQLHPFGLYTDYNGSLLNVEKAALFGNSKVSIEYQDFFAGILILRHNSKAKVRVNGKAFLIVNILDTAYIDIEAVEDSQVAIYIYGSDPLCITSGNVQIKYTSWKK